MKFLIEGLGEIARQILFSALSIVWVVACFWVFDLFHITNTAAQILVAIAPFLALAFWVWRRDRIK